MRSLVLVGHGSHRSGDAAAPVYALAERLRALNAFDEVLEAFWKDDPSLRQVLRTAASTDVTVVPLFIAPGYFTDVVLPRELNLGHQGPVPPEGIARVMGARTVRYTRPFGTHPAMRDVILARVREVLPDLPAAPEVGAAPDVALVLVSVAGGDPHAHGLEAHAGQLRDTGLFREVRTLAAPEGEAPGGAWLEGLTAAQVVVVPFSASDAAHTRTGLPARLGLPGPVTALPGGPTVLFTAAAGTHPDVAQVVLQVAADAHSGAREGDAERAHHAAWDALRTLVSGEARIGELLITPQHGVYEFRHALDQGTPGSELTTIVTTEGLRDHARTDDRGRHRPVRTFRTLPRGWRAVIHPAELRRALHDVYPAVTEEAYAHGCYTLRATPWPTTARRQTGSYARVQKAGPDVLARVTRDVCGQCLRTPLWAGEKLPRTFLEGVPGAMPCAEACTYLIAHVREELRPDAAGHVQPD